MPMANSMPSRPSLLTIAALAETGPATRPAPNSGEAGQATPQIRDATTPLFYILLSLIMLALILGLLR